MQIGKWEFPEYPVRYHDTVLIDDRLGLNREIRWDVVSEQNVAITRDADGNVTDAGYMSACCTAAVTYSGSQLCCKKCWHAVPYELDALVDLKDVQPL